MVGEQIDFLHIKDNILQNKKELLNFVIDKQIYQINSKSIISIKIDTWCKRIIFLVKKEI